MTVYEYARTSTPKQKIERQLHNIKHDFPGAIIFSEAYTGTKIERPEFDKLLKIVKSGDTIVFDSVSRMSRDAQDGFNLYQDLYNKDINLIFLKEHHIDTDIYRQALQTQIDSTGNEIADCYIEATNKVLMILARQQIEIAFTQAQAEVDHIRQLTKDGVARAKARAIAEPDKYNMPGRKTGATPKLQKEAPAKQIIKQYSKDFNGTLNDSEVMAILASKEYDHKSQTGKTEKKSLKLARNTYYKYKSDLKAENT